MELQQLRTKVEYEHVYDDYLAFIKAAVGGVTKKCSNLGQSSEGGPAMKKSTMRCFPHTKVELELPLKLTFKIVFIIHLYLCI